MNKKITAKKVGRKDWMGRAWYKIIVNGKEVTKKGIVEMWKATDENHAIACYKQFN